MPRRTETARPDRAPAMCGSRSRRRPIALPEGRHVGADAGPRNRGGRTLRHLPRRTHRARRGPRVADRVNRRRLRGRADGDAEIDVAQGARRPAELELGPLFQHSVCGVDGVGDFGVAVPDRLASFRPAGRPKGAVSRVDHVARPIHQSHQNRLRVRGPHNTRLLPRRTLSTLPRSARVSGVRSDPLSPYGDGCRRDLDHRPNGDRTGTRAAKTGDAGGKPIA